MDFEKKTIMDFNEIYLKQMDFEKKTIMDFQRNIQKWNQNKKNLQWILSKRNNNGFYAKKTIMPFKEMDFN